MILDIHGVNNQRKNSWVFCQVQNLLYNSLWYASHFEQLCRCQGPCADGQGHSERGKGEGRILQMRSATRQSEDSERGKSDWAPAFLLWAPGSTQKDANNSQVQTGPFTSPQQPRHASKPPLSAGLSLILLISTNFRALFLTIILLHNR